MLTEEGRSIDMGLLQDTENVLLSFNSSSALFFVFYQKSNQILALRRRLLNDAYFSMLRYTDIFSSSSTRIHNETE